MRCEHVVVVALELADIQCASPRVGVDVVELNDAADNFLTCFMGSGRLGQLRISPLCRVG